MAVLTLKDFEFTRSGRDSKYDIELWLNGDTHVLRQARLLSTTPVLDDDGNQVMIGKDKDKPKVAYNFDPEDTEADFDCTIASLKASLNTQACAKGGGLNSKANGAMGMTIDDEDGNPVTVDYPHLVVRYSPEPLRTRKEDSDDEDSNDEDGED